VDAHAFCVDLVMNRITSAYMGRDEMSMNTSTTDGTLTYTSVGYRLDTHARRLRTQIYSFMSTEN
jgi:hypothetical protein